MKGKTAVLLLGLLLIAMVPAVSAKGGWIPGADYNTYVREPNFDLVATGPGGKPNSAYELNTNLYARTRAINRQGDAIGPWMHPSGKYRMPVSKTDLNRRVFNTRAPTGDWSEGHFYSKRDISNPFNDDRRFLSEQYAQLYNFPLAR